MGKESKPQSGQPREVSLAGFIFRFIAALLLVLATYNPSEISFFDWVQKALSGRTLGPEHFFVGVLLLIGWSFYVVATIRSLGTLGLLLGGAFFATLIWLLIDFGVLSVSSAASVTWIALVCLAGLLSIGLVWSHVWRRVTGQVEVNDDD